ncbi:TadE/TadG family type IV pilus assembly protein [Chelativorans xinjiangense]|uniref:TadE/TadG family type IV pilus assembly protein n=1 Tax=Chelativorans xinjiangense TaxID=2681485 RepID=UPI001359F376|nr:TadE/TadG family type IV pilus assembly protein [Chelativorans xinjiangense]
MGTSKIEAEEGRRLMPRALLGRFLRDRKGVAAIEFAALAIPFFLLLFAILESCVAFAAQQVMANATFDIARQVRTGQLRPDDLKEDKLRERLCARMSVFVSANCLEELEVDLRAYDTFEEAAKLRIKYTPGGDIDTSDFRVEPGDALSKNMLRVFYRWPVMTDFMRKSMSNLPDGKTLLFSTTAWQNEPY